MSIITNKFLNYFKSDRFYFAIIFFLLMVVDWTRGSQVGAVWAWTVNMTGVLLAMIAIKGIGIRKVLTRESLLIVIITICMLVGGYNWWLSHQDMIYRDQLMTAIMNLGCWSAILWALVKNTSISEIKANINPISFARVCGVVALGLMFISRNEDIWPIWYLMMFTVIYWIKWEKSTLEELLDGLLDGLIGSFFFLQGLAFVFRPYDMEYYRYSGMYSNFNINAIFYEIVYIAILIRLFILRRNQCNKWAIRLHFCLVACPCGFMLMTGCRTAWISVLVVTLVYIVFCDIVILRTKPLLEVSRILCMIVLICCFLRLDYAMARYIPPIFHHPIWYEGEYSESKVHSWDSWDSEKYVSYDEMMEGITDRIIPYMRLIFGDSASIGHVYAVEDSFENEWLSNPEDYQMDEKMSGALEELSQSYQYHSLVGRVLIWNYFLKNGNLLGHKNSEGHQIGVTWYVWHTQNLFLQVWYYYGIPAACFMIVAILGTIGSAIKQSLRDNCFAVITLLFMTGYITLGMLEAVWYPGQITLLLACFTPLLLKHADK